MLILMGSRFTSCWNIYISHRSSTSRNRGSIEKLPFKYFHKKFHYGLTTARRGIYSLQMKPLTESPKARAGAMYVRLHLYTRMVTARTRGLDLLGFNPQVDGLA